MFYLSQKVLFEIQVMYLNVIINLLIFYCIFGHIYFTNYLFCVYEIYISVMSSKKIALFLELFLNTIYRYKISIYLARNSEILIVDIKFLL